MNTPSVFVVGRERERGRKWVRKEKEMSEK